MDLTRIEIRGYYMAGDYVIKSVRLNKKFGDFELNLTDFGIPKGLATALVGENGAGKSTLLNILSGIRRDYKGDLTYFDKFKNIEEKGLRDMIGYTGTGMYFIPSWTGNQIRELSKIMYKDFNEDKFMNIWIMTFLQNQQNLIQNYQMVIRLSYSLRVYLLEIQSYLLWMNRHRLLIHL